MIPSRGWRSLAVNPVEEINAPLPPCRFISRLLPAACCSSRIAAAARTVGAAAQGEDEVRAVVVRSHMAIDTNAGDSEVHRLHLCRLEVVRRDPHRSREFPDKKLPPWLSDALARQKMGQVPQGKPREDEKSKEDEDEGVLNDFLFYFFLYREITRSQICHGRIIHF